MHGTQKIKSKIESISLTPEIAASLLEHNNLNRPLSDQHVIRIANQIRKDKWRFNGDTIKIASNGEIVDGQHRLWAVIEAKKPIETIVVWGVEPEAFATIDTLSKPRSGGDILALHGLRRHGKPTAEALKWLLRWQRKCLPEYRAPQNRIENSDIEAAYDVHPKMVHAIERAMKTRRICNASIMGFLCYIIYNRSAELAERMMFVLENPAQVALNDPFYKFREYLHRDHTRTKNPLMTIALAFKAANAAKAGKRVERLVWVNQGQKAEAFPTLEI